MDDAAATALIEQAESANARLGGGDDASVIAEVDARYPELREALDWLLADGRPDDAFRLASALVRVWMATNRLVDADAWFERALAMPAGSDGARARALYNHGYLVFWAGRYELADERFAAARALADRIGDAEVVALALAGAARVALTRDPRTAIPMLREAIARTDATPDSPGRSGAQHVLGVALQMTGDLEAAGEVMRARLDHARSAGNEFVVFVESSNLSMVERRLGHLDEAEALSRVGIGIVGRRRDRLACAWAINGLAAVTAARGDLRRAATLLAAADALIDAAGGEWPPDEREQHDETVALLAAGLDADGLQEASAEGAAMSLDGVLAFALS